MRGWRGFGLWVALALLIRIAAGIVFAETLERAIDEGIARDAALAYLPLADALLERGELAIRPGEATASHVPGFPLLLAGALAVGGRSPWSTLAMQIALGSLAVGLLYRLALALEGQRVAHATGFAAAVFPDLVTYSLLPLSEIPQLVFALGASLFMLALLRTPRAASAAGVGLCLACALMIREETLLLVALWTAVLLRSSWRLPAIVAALCVAALIPWWVRNWTAFGEFVPLTTKGASNLYQGTMLRPYPVTDHRNEGLPLDPEQAAREAEVQRRKEAATSVAERDRLLLEAALDNVRRDPWAQVAHVGRKLVWLWSPNIGPRHGERVGSPLALWTASLLHFAVLALGVAGLVLRRRSREVWLLLTLPLLAATALHLVIGGAEPRYHFSSWPALLIGACVALDPWLGRAASALRGTRSAS